MTHTEEMEGPIIVNYTYVSKPS